MDSFIKPYTATNPQLIGALWRIRSVPHANQLRTS